MITHNCKSSVFINLGSHFISRGKNARSDNAAVDINAVRILCGILHDKFCAIKFNHACVGNLTARGCIKRSFIKNYRALFTCSEHFNLLTVGVDKSKNFCLALKIRIADELCFLSLNLNALAFPSVCTCVLTSGTGSCLLVCKKFVKSILVNSHSLFL